MKKLATLNSLIEVEMLKELFEDNGIQLIVKHQESGDFMTHYMGNTIYGIDVHVAAEQYDQALDLYKGFFKGDFTAVD